MSALRVNLNVADAPTGIPPLGPPSTQPVHIGRADDELAITERVDVDVHTTGGGGCWETAQSR